MSAAMPPPSLQQSRRQRFKASKVAAPSEDQSKKSFIWDWLEGKLENKSSNFPRKGMEIKERVPTPQHQVSGSSPQISVTGPVLVPIPLQAVPAPQHQVSSSSPQISVAGPVLAPIPLQVVPAPQHQVYGSSPQISVTGPVLAPIPLQAVPAIQHHVFGSSPQPLSSLSGSLGDNTVNLVAVYDPSSNSLLYMNINEYINVFGAPPPFSTPVQNFDEHIYNLFREPTPALPPPDENFNELESECIDMLQSAFSLEENVPLATLEEVTGHKEYQELPDEENKVEEIKEKEKEKEKEMITYVRRSKMKPKLKTIQIGAIDVDVPLKKFETVNRIPIWTTPSSCPNIEEATVNEGGKYELPRVVEEGQGSAGSGDDRKKDKKKKNEGNK